MKLVETEIAVEGDDSDATSERPRPPRPERRRVYVSLFLTLSVLCATVVTIYTVFPKRDNELVTSAIEAHRERNRFQLVQPGLAELDAWTISVMGEPVPWPETGGPVQVLGTRAMRILRRPAALIRLRIAKQELTLLAMKARDAPPRKYRRSDDGELAMSWRLGQWTFVVVGPSDSEGEWREQVGVP